jgi:D-proline reductase (dithiol) PrdB
VYERPSPRHPLEVSLGEARVALVSTAGAHLPEQLPFASGSEGDPSYRELPAGAEELRFSHVGYDVRRPRRDAGVVFPLGLLRALAAERVIGGVASRAYSFMGYVPDPRVLLEETGPAVARELVADAVDLALLVPA